MIFPFVSAAVIAVSSGAVHPKVHHALPGAHPAHAAPSVSVFAPHGDGFASGRLGFVTLYRPSGTPTSIVLFLSGDGGWSLGVVSMAKDMAAQGAVVAGIDTVKYLKAVQAQSQGACEDLAGELAGLAHEVEAKSGAPATLKPILAGYSSGATLAYAVLMQSPRDIFAGSVALGFCPDLWLTSPMCSGSGLSFSKNPKAVGVLFDAAKHSTAPFIALQGDQDQVCSPQDTKKFVESLKDGRIVMLPKVGHGFGVERNWLPQFRDAYKALMGG